MSENNITDNIAVYIDGDNASYNDFSFVHKEIKKYGRIIIGRIYGDWSTDAMNGWRDISINNAFESINCFSLSRKNSTDIHLICDVLRDLYNNKIINTYIIVSSDSDFSHVTKRIRAAGKRVIGVGRNNTPKMLKNACDIFISNEVLKNIDESYEESDYEIDYKNNSEFIISKNNEEIDSKNYELGSNDDSISINSDDITDNYDNSDEYSYEKYSNKAKNDINLLNIIKSFKGKKKILISKLKCNLSKICDVKNIYENDFTYFDKYLIKNYINYFRVKYVNYFKGEKEINLVFIYNIVDIKDTLKNLFEMSNDEYFNISKVKDTLLRRDPTFDQRSYGYQSMKDFLENIFNIDYEIFQKNNCYYIKKK